jgi:hypothetical protein
MVKSRLHSSLCPKTNFSSHLKQRPLVHLSAISAGERRLLPIDRTDSDDVATPVDPGAWEEDVVHGLDAEWLAYLPVGAGTDTMTNRCSLACANVMVASREVGCLSVTSVRNGSPRSVMKS